VLICLDTAQYRRTFMKKVSLMDMISEEYVYVMIGVDINGDDVDPKMLKDFQAKVVARVRDDPLYCDTLACMSNDGKAVMTKGYTNEATTLWATRDGQRPLARPKCGYTGTECPKPFWEQYGIYVIVAAAVVGVLLIAAIMFIVYVIRTRKKEQEQQRLLWQIPYMKLRKPPTSRELQQQSKRSLQSGKSVLTGDSKLTESNFGDYEIYYLEGDSVLTTKYPVTGLTDEDCSRFPQ
ncbi:hypothetical protein TELCIR_16764, partial [Teladorsagia circumcincta]